MKISDYKIRKFDPDSCGELITTVEISHYGFKCHGEVYTCNGELDNDYIVTAKIKFVGKFRKKDGGMKTITDYDSTVSEINETTIRELIEFCAKYDYLDYKNNGK